MVRCTSWPKVRVCWRLGTKPYLIEDHVLPWAGQVAQVVAGEAVGLAHVVHFRRGSGQGLDIEVVELGQFQVAEALERVEDLAAVLLHEHQQVLGAAEGHIEEAHGIELGHPVQWLAILAEHAAHSAFQRTGGPFAFGHVAHHHHLELEALALVDGEEGHAAFREGVVVVLVLALAQAPQCVAELAEEGVREAVPRACTTR